MIRSLKLFASYVDSMLKAEKDNQMKPEPAAKKIMVDLQKMVDECLEWIKAQEYAELGKGLTPFFHMPNISNNNLLDRTIKQQF